MRAKVVDAAYAFTLYMARLENENEIGEEKTAGDKVSPSNL